MSGSRKASTTNAILSVVIILGILVVINFLSSRHFSRVDLTESKQFTITQSTRNILGRLDDVVNIRVYFTGNNKLPSRLVSLGQQVKDLLDEYGAYADGNLNIQFIDPEGNPEDETAARQLGIPQVPLQIIEKDKLQILNAYLGIAILYGDKSEVMPQVLDVRNLEYDLTSKILKVTQAEQKTVGFLTGHGELDLETDLSGIKGALEEQYRVVPVPGGKPVPQDVTTLIVAGPKQVPERDKYEIDQFIMRGGKAVFLLDAVDIVPGRLQARVAESGLEDLMKHYGVTLSKELVVDPVNVNASFNMGRITFSLPYPFWPRVTESGFSEESPIVSDLSMLVLPWAGPTVVADGGEDSSSVDATVLAKSSPGSWVQTGFFDLNPQQRFVNPGGEEKEYPLAVALGGGFGSFYLGKEIPEAGVGEGEEPPETLPLLEVSPMTQIVVVGSSSFAKNDFLRQFPSGGVFILNTVDWLTIGEDLIGIRSRALESRPLKEISEGAKAAVKFINIFAVPLLVIIYGLVRVYARRRARKIYEAYGA
ncbi:MAG: GldG family protein [Candidatus Eisenbacteria sp.]|nr:GldG family protein [Candidatus Eisenbacteria bacterium]